MTTTLTYSSTVIELHDDLLWSDEFTWQQVEQRKSHSITGALIVEAAQKQAGRPITLSGGPNHAWISRAVLDALQAQAAEPGRVLSLVLRGAAARDVIFDHEVGAIEADPILDYADPDAADVYAVTLRLIEV